MLDEKETALALKRAKEGDNEAKELLLKHNSCLLKSIVKRYLNKGVEYDDLYQLACIGLLKAIAGFDFSYEVRFSTYAVPMIAGEIKRYLRDDGSIKVSRIIKKSAKDIAAFVSAYTAEEGDAPSIKRIAEKFGMDESEVVFTMGSQRMPLSLYDKGDYKDEETGEMVDRIPSQEDPDALIDRLQLKDAIESLPEREKKIILLRYFRDMTQSEVAKAIGVSQVQVSRIESKVIAEFKARLC